MNHNLADLQKEIATLKRKLEMLREKNHTLHIKLAEKDAENALLRLAIRQSQTVRLKIEGEAGC